MRLLHTFDNEHEAQIFSSFLTNEGMINQLEISPITDWGSPEYGTIKAKIWVIDEDDTDASHELLNLYLANPQDTRFTNAKVVFPPDIELMTEKEEEPKLIQEPSSPVRKPGSIGILTLYLIIGCTLLFFITQATIPRLQELPPPSIPPTPILSSPIKKPLFYDYPYAYEILDKIAHAYGYERLFNPNLLPPEGHYLLNEFYRTPYWQGIYPKIVNYFTKPKQPLTFQGPMFEKLQQGQYWRLITPCLLHTDLFHLFFNMIWLLVLGRQIENRIKAVRYLVFLLVSGIFSNTAQYLMSGANFIGFSGILCAMITFVWSRQKQAPWEGYQLLPITMAFITVFVLAMAAIQLISFLLEISGQSPFSSGIANTAHLAGALIGLILARLKYFTWQPYARK